MTETEIMEIISGKVKSDFTYDSGRILSSMCSKPDRLSMKIYSMFLEKNLGDPFLFPSCKFFEEEVVNMLGELLSNKKAAGFIVSGGTEANILSMWVAVKNSSVKKPEVLAPETVHFSFDKASSLLGFRLIKIGLNDEFQVNVNEMKKRLTSNTVAIVGVAGSSGLGVVDSIPELNELAEENHLYLHVDAAFGGLIIPFLKEEGVEVPDFDFKLSSVSSITVDPHKAGFTPIPSGCILFKNKELIEDFGFEVKYGIGETYKQKTLLGTRPCAATIATWAALKHLGKNGFRERVKYCLKLTNYFVSKIKNFDRVKLVVAPQLNIVGFKTAGLDESLVVKKLREKGWGLTLYKDFIRIILLPHISFQNLEEFLHDLKNILRGLRK